MNYTFLRMKKYGAQTSYKGLHNISEQKKAQSNYKALNNTCINRSHRSRRVRHEISSAGRKLGSWVRIPLKEWMFVRFEVSTAVTMTIIISQKMIIIEWMFVCVFSVFVIGSDLEIG
jgi:hypothetical protein